MDLRSSVLVALAVGCAAPCAMAGPAREEPPSARSMVQIEPAFGQNQIRLPGVVPQVQFTTTFGYQLMADITNWIRTLNTEHRERRPLSNVSFRSSSAALVPAAITTTARVAGSDSKKSLENESVYRWLLRSQKRNVLRSERGRGFSAGLEAPRKNSTTGRPGDIRTEVTMFASKKELSTGADTGLPASVTEVRVDVPIFGASRTSLLGRVSGESGYFTWVAGANVAYAEIEGHAMNAGMQMGSALYQNALAVHDEREELFVQQWSARVYAQDHWRIHGRYGIAYGLSYQRTNYPSAAGFFNPNLAFVIDLGAGFRLDNHFAYGVNLPGKMTMLGWTSLPDSYPFAEGRPLQPERFTAYKARIEKRIRGGHTVDFGYVLEKVENPLLQVPYRDLSAQRDPFAYRIMLANATPMRSSNFRVGYRAQLGAHFTSDVAYRVGKAKSLDSITPSSHDGIPFVGAVDSSYVHTISATLSYSVPKTSTNVSGTYRWDSQLTLRPDYMSEAFDDPTTQLNIRVRQGIPYISNGTTNWEFLLDVKNPVQFGDETNLMVGSDAEVVQVVPHPRRITGGLTLKF